MPARSRSQQRLFGMVHAYNKGELKGSKSLKKRIASIADNISDEDARHFAETTHKGLPEKKGEYSMDYRFKAIEKLAQDDGSLFSRSKASSGASKARIGSIFRQHKPEKRVQTRNNGSYGSVAGAEALGAAGGAIKGLVNMPANAMTGFINLGAGLNNIVMQAPGLLTKVVTLPFALGSNYIDEGRIHPENKGMKRWSEAYNKAVDHSEYVGRAVDKQLGFKEFRKTVEDVRRQANLNYMLRNGIDPSSMDYMDSQAAGLNIGVPYSIGKIAPWFYGPSKVKPIGSAPVKSSIGGKLIGAGGKLFNAALASLPVVDGFDDVIDNKTMIDDYNRHINTGKKPIDMPEWLDYLTR